MENRHQKSTNGFDSDLVGENRALRCYARKESNLHARRPEPKSGASTNPATRASSRGAWPTAVTYCFATPRLVNADYAPWPSAWQNLRPICQRNWVERGSVVECGSPCRFRSFSIGTKAVREHSSPRQLNN